MPKATRLIRNTAINGSAAIASAAIAIVLTSVLLRRMGENDYGLWLLALTLTFDRGYLAILDLGMGTAALQKLSVIDNLRENFSAKRIVATLRTLYFFLSLLGVLLIVVIGRRTLEAVSENSSSDTVIILVLVMVLRLPIDMSHGANVLVLESQQRYIWIRGLEVTANFLWLVVVIIGTSHGWALSQLAFTSLALSIFQFAISSYLRQSLIGQQVSMFRTASLEESMELWKTGRWVALQKVNGVIYSQMDRLIIAFVIGIGAVGEYEVPYKIQALGVLALSILPSAVFPVAAKIGASADRKLLSDLFHRGTRLAVIACVPPLIALVFAADDLVAVWVGDQYLYLAGSVQLFNAWVFLAVFHVVGATMLMATRHNRELFLIGFVSIAVNLPLSLWLSRYWGMNGVIAGTLCGYIVVWIPYLVLEQRVLGTGYYDWWKFVLKPVLVPIALEIVAITFLKNYWVIDNRIFYMAFYCLPGILIAWGTFFIFFMDESDKRTLYLMRKGNQ
jgi:O-antigen/teichoic acid export membrane protein